MLENSVSLQVGPGRIIILLTSAGAAVSRNLQEVISQISSQVRGDLQGLAFALRVRTCTLASLT
jgi:hypothetical protein